MELKRTQMNSFEISKKKCLKKNMATDNVNMKHENFKTMREIIFTIWQVRCTMPAFKDPSRNAPKYTTVQNALHQNIPGD
jgi:hypothetical protein